MLWEGKGDTRCEDIEGDFLLISDGESLLTADRSFGDQPTCLSRFKSPNLATAYWGLRKEIVRFNFSASQPRLSSD
jgi:hypothetical protein